VTLTADGKTAAKDSTLVERWLEDQREWQRTAMAYLDSMVKNEDFLVHLGNAMRGSLLAGKPYPAAPPAGQPAVQEAPVDNRVDQVLFALHQIQGQLTDLRMAFDELRNRGKASSSAMPATRPTVRSGSSHRPGSRSASAARWARIASIRAPIASRTSPVSRSTRASPDDRRWVADRIAVVRAFMSA